MAPISLARIQKILQDNEDITYRKIVNNEETIIIIFAGNISDAHYISEVIIKPLVETKEKKLDVETIQNSIITASNTGILQKEEEAILHILQGNAVVLVPSLSSGIFCEVKQYKKRAVETPPAEAVLKGPREGFTEDISDNISMLTKRVKDSRLKLEKVHLEDTCNTLVMMAYLEDRVCKKTLAYIQEKLQNMPPVFVITAAKIEELLEEKPTAFDTIGYTEKPDIAAARLGEGRVAIFVDGTPIVLTAPYFFLENFQSPDDYYLNRYTVNALRLLRWIGFFISVFVLPLYLALITYHFSLIPTVFVFRLAVSRAGVPFPAILEVLLMMFFFQILREAGVRLPQSVGQSISIVGALILGDTAINSGLASSITVLVVALVSISSFLLPKVYGGIWLWSDIMILFSAFLGLPGFYISFILFWSHLSSLRSCGYPYLFPLGTLKSYRYRDVIFKGEEMDMYKPIFRRGEEDEK